MGLQFIESNDFKSAVRDDKRKFPTSLAAIANAANYYVGFSGIEPQDQPDGAGGYTKYDIVGGNKNDGWVFEKSNAKLVSVESKIDGITLPNPLSDYNFSSFNVGDILPDVSLKASFDQWGWYAQAGKNTGVEFEVVADPASISGKAIQITEQSNTDHDAQFRQYIEGDFGGKTISVATRIKVDRNDIDFVGGALLWMYDENGSGVAGTVMYLPSANGVTGADFPNLNEYRHVYTSPALIPSGVKKLVIVFHRFKNSVNIPVGQTAKATIAAASYNLDGIEETIIRGGLMVEVAKASKDGSTIVYEAGKDINTKVAEVDAVANAANNLAGTADTKADSAKVDANNASLKVDGIVLPNPFQNYNFSESIIDTIMPDTPIKSNLNTWGWYAKDAKRNGVEFKVISDPTSFSGKAIQVVSESDTGHDAQFGMFLEGDFGGKSISVAMRLKVDRNDINFIDGTLLWMYDAAGNGVAGTVLYLPNASGLNGADFPNVNEYRHVFSTPTIIPAGVYKIQLILFRLKSSANIPATETATLTIDSASYNLDGVEETIIRGGLMNAVYKAQKAADTVIHSDGQTIEQKVTYLEQSIVNKLAGKVVFGLGDSITAHGNSWLNDFISVAPIAHLWNVAVSSALFKHQVGTVVTNHPSKYEEDGVTHAADNRIASQVTKVIELQATDSGGHADPDIIIIAAGINDSATMESEAIILEQLEYGKKLIPVGEQDSYPTDNLEDPADYVDRTTFVGAVRWAIQTLREHFPYAIVMLSTPLQANYTSDGGATYKGHWVDRKNQNEVMKMIAQRLSVPVIDPFSELGLSDATEPENGANNSDGDIRFAWTSDGLHPGTAGKIMHRNYMATRISNLYFKRT